MNYGILFVGLEVLGETRRRFLGAWGLHTVSVVEGLGSSASAVASDASLGAYGLASLQLAGNAALLASIAVNAIIVERVARVPSLLRTTIGMVVTLVLTGCIVLAGQRLL